MANTNCDENYTSHSFLSSMIEISRTKVQAFTASSARLDWICNREDMAYPLETDAFQA